MYLSESYGSNLHKGDFCWIVCLYQTSKRRLQYDVISHRNENGTEKSRSNRNHITVLGVFFLFVFVFEGKKMKTGNQI